MLLIGVFYCMLKAICSKKDLTSNSYYDCVSDIVEADEVVRLKNITHHISTTRYQHCINVSYYNHIICRKLGLDAVSAARAGLLHDLFYYDRKEYNRNKQFISHSAFHSMLALENAEKLIDLNDCECDIIEKHMWPVTKRLPKYKESYVIVIVDKYCAILECCIPKIQKLCKKKKKNPNLSENL